MGDELLKQSSPDEGDSNVPLYSYTEIFEKQFPHYLAIGMTPHMYWHEDCTLVKAYREADRIKLKRMNEEQWLQGRYFYDALLCASPMFVAFAKNAKPIPYPDTPYAIDEDSKKEIEAKKEKAEYDAQKAKWNRMMNAVNAKFARKAGEQNG